MEFYRQEYWSGLPFPSPGDSSGPGDRTRVSHIAGSVSHQGSPLVASLVREPWRDAGSPGDRPTHRLVELHLLLQVQADDAVVVVDPVTVEVIHLGCNQDQDISVSAPWTANKQLCLWPSYDSSSARLACASS